MAARFGTGNWDGLSISGGNTHRAVIGANSNTVHHLIWTVLVYCVFANLELQLVQQRLVDQFK